MAGTTGLEPATSAVTDGLVRPEKPPYFIGSSARLCRSGQDQYQS